MELEDIKIGSTLEIEFLVDKVNCIKAFFSSQLESIDGQTLIVSTTNTENEHDYKLLHGAKIEIYLVERVDLQVFDGEVISIKNVDNTRVLEIKKTSVLERIQRRQFQRIECNYKFKYRIIDIDKEHNDINFFETCLMDMGGGGLLFISDSKIAKDTIIECILLLGEEGIFKFRGKVLRCGELLIDNKLVYKTGITFKGINNMDREIIIRHIFRGLRKNKKGMGTES